MIYEPIPFKQCCTCQQWFPATLEYFYAEKTKRMGVSSRCRTCQRAITRARATADPERERQRVKQWHDEHQEQERQRLKEYSIKHPEKRTAAARKWRDTHRELANERVKRCYLADPTKDRERRKRARKANPHPSRVRVLRRRALRRALPNALTAEQWQESLNYWGGCCAYCGNPTGLLPGMEITADHFIPLADRDCPGTVWSNMIPACGSCNKSKQHGPVSEWLTKRYGSRKAKAILTRIAAYFEWVAGENHVSAHIM